MIDHTYVGESVEVGSRFYHHAFWVSADGKHVANGLDITFPDGSIAIRIFDYDVELESDLRQYFTCTGVKEITF